MTNVIHFTCTPPDQRKRKIEQNLHEVDFSTGPTLRAFGLQVNSRMVETTGRQLPLVKIDYSGGSRENPRDSAWNMRGKRYHVPVTIKSGAVISLCKPRLCGLAEIQKFF